EPSRPPTRGKPRSKHLTTVWKCAPQTVAGRGPRRPRRTHRRLRRSDMRALTRGMVLVSFFLLAGWYGSAGAQSQSGGRVTVAFAAAIAPAVPGPAETPGIGTPFVFLYAMHDALIKPLPRNDMAPCLAESWKESPDGLVYEFKLRPGLKFHNGDPFTADDVKFTFQRYKG